MESGTITHLTLERGYGFIRPRSGADIFFHVSTLGGGMEWDSTLLRREVTFDVEMRGDKTRAINVMPAR